MHFRVMPLNLYPIKAMFHTIHVHNYHLDGYGHVNNARYLEFLEEARWTFFQQNQLLSQLRAFNLVVTHADIHYRHTAILDDILYIYSKIILAQSRKIILHQNIIIHKTQKTALQAHITLMPTAHNKVLRLSETLLSQLQTLASS